MCGYVCCEKQQLIRYEVLGCPKRERRKQKGNDMRILEHYQPPGSQDEGELISVIVAAYNIEAYVEKGLRSICEQTYRNLEVIVVDDGSTDRSGEICDQYADRHPDNIVAVRKENGGVSSAG